MRKHGFLAKTLACVLTAAMVLPSALTANAARIVTSETVADALAGTWTPELKNENIGGAEGYWHLISGSGNSNSNSDFGNINDAACILDMDQDVSFTEEAKTVSTVIRPVGDGAASNMRFGIMISYVDGTHWAFLNWDTNRWLLQYKCDNLNSYPQISDLSGVSLANDKDTLVDITYQKVPAEEDAELVNTVTITMREEGGEEKTAVLSDTDGIFSALEAYAATAGAPAEGDTPAQPLPIRYGFKAGTFGATLTDVFLKGMSFGQDSMMDDTWEWSVKPAEGSSDTTGRKIDFSAAVGGQDYKSVDASASETAVVSSISEETGFADGTVTAVVRPVSDTVSFAVDARYTPAAEATEEQAATEESKVSVGYNGTSWYYTLGQTVTEVKDVALTPAKDTHYVLTMEIDDNVLSATVKEEAAEAPAAEDEDAAVTIVKDIQVPETVTAGSVALEAGAGATLYVKSLSYTKVTKEEAAELKEAYETIKGEKGEENTDNKYYSDLWEAYETALNAAGDKVNDDTAEITAAEANTLKSALTTASNNLKTIAGSSQYTALTDLISEAEADKQADGPWDDASWTAFTSTLTAAKAVVTQITNKESVATTDVTGATTTLNAARNGRVERAATAEEAAALKAQYDYDKNAAVAQANNNDYTDETWDAYAAAKDNAAKLLADPTTKASVLAAALDELKTATAALAPKLTDAEQKTALGALIATAAAKKNDNYTDASWAAFTKALADAQKLTASDTATWKEVDAAMKALGDAEAKLTKKSAPVAPENPVPAKNAAKKIGVITYKVTKSDAKNGTVTVSKIDASAKKAVIPSTVKIDGYTFKVTAVNAKAAVGCKKLTNVTIGANVTSIGKQAFNKCKKLKAVTFKGTKAVKIGAKAFTGNAKKVTVTTAKKMAKKQLNTLKKSLKKAGLKKVTYKKK